MLFAITHNRCPVELVQINNKKKKSTQNAWCKVMSNKVVCVTWKQGLLLFPFRDKDKLLSLAAAIKTPFNFDNVQVRSHKVKVLLQWPENQNSAIIKEDVFTHQYVFFLFFF